MSSPARDAAPPNAPSGAQSGTSSAATAAPATPPAKPARVRRDQAKPVSVARPDARRRKLVVRRLGLLSVLKVSIAFYLASVAVFVAALFSVWLIAEATGAIGNLEKFVADLFAYDEFRFVSWQLFQAVVVLAIVWTALATTMTMIAAAFYNILSGMIGGIEVTLDEDA